MVTDEEQGREAEFLDTLQKLEKGTVPVSTTEQADAAEARLNTAYQRIQHTTDTAAWGTVTKDGIRTAQRAWLRYRDAWIAFAQARHSTVHPAEPPRGADGAARDRARSLPAVSARSVPARRSCRTHSAISRPF